MYQRRMFKCDSTVPFDTAFWESEREALRIMNALKALGWVFWE